VIRLLLAIAAVAAPLHVEPQISEAPAASRTTFGFVVEHGCDGSATVQVSIQVPEGAFDVVPAAPAGWTGVVESGTPAVVTFSGGPLAADVAETFAMELVTPNRPGETVFFPTVQTCEVGEIGWIDLAEEAEEPAPRIVLTENANPILPATSTTATSLDTTATTLAATTTPPPGDDDEDDSDDDGGVPPLVFVVIGLAAGIGLGLFLRARRT
jgi:periplasmic copper chaperone A